MYLFITIFVIIILFSLLVGFYYNKAKHIPPTDIVYTWVETTPEFIAEKNKYLKNTSYVNDEGSSKIRYENHDELKYSLRSLMNFPYYRNIYIVVKDGQRPDFLNNNSNVKIINHSEIIPHKYLPTFNSHTIEAFLHHIPGLSDNYIYFNDDFMIMNPLDKNFFIDSQTGKPLILTSFDKCDKCDNKISGLLNHSNEIYNFQRGWKITNNLLDTFKYEKSRYYVSHVPKIYNKNYDMYIQKVFENFYIDNQYVDLYDLQSSYKFRNNSQLFLNVLIKPYLYNYLFNCEFKFVSESLKRLNSNFHLTDQDMQSEFLCVADEDNDKSNLQSYYEYMEYMFPTKSEYEI
jgi:hypothetical protein